MTNSLLGKEASQLMRLNTSTEVLILSFFSEYSDLLSNNNFLTGSGGGEGDGDGDGGEGEGEGEGRGERGEGRGERGERRGERGAG